MDGARNMNKYDTMLAVNKKRNKRKIDTAKKEIYKMLENGEKVTVTKLIEQTGLSRGFFYKNEEVRALLDRAVEQQAGMVSPYVRTLKHFTMVREICLRCQKTD